MFRIFRYLKKFRLHVILGPLFKLLEAVLELFVPLIMAKIIDIGVREQNIPYVLKMGGVILLLGIIGYLSAMVCQTLASKCSQGFGGVLREELFAHINTLSHKELDRFGAASLVTRMTSDINTLQDAVAKTLRLVPRAPFLAIGAIIMALRISRRITVVFVIVAILIALVLYLIMRFSVPHYKVIAKKLDTITRISRETLSGARSIRAFGREETQQRKFLDASGDYTDTAVHVGKISALLNPLTSVIVNFGIVAILYFGSIQINIGALTQGETISLVSYMTQILLALIIIANMVVLFTKAAASAVRVNEVLDTKPAIRDGTVRTGNGSDTLVSFRSVFFSYTEDDKYALKNIDLQIKKNETLGIIGTTGSGKTTLVSLIPRFYDATKGEVLFDGVPVKEYELAALRGKIGFVMQQARLFTGTLRENMQYFKKDAADEEIWRALRISQAEEFVLAKGKGLDLYLSAGGKNLSGGQRQRLNIARAICGMPSLLILDDSSSALDFKTDALLRGALAQLDSTKIIIAQRISSVRGADRIAVLAEGELRDCGTHEELLSRCAEYLELYRSQTKE